MRNVRFSRQRPYASTSASVPPRARKRATVLRASISDHLFADVHHFNPRSYNACTIHVLYVRLKLPFQMSSSTGPCSTVTFEEYEF